MALAPVLVSGATGFIATELIKQLLAKGHNVRGTVRSLADESKTKTLRALAAALPGTLELFEADLLKDGSFDEAVKGSEYVFHTASPFFVKWKESPDELIKPAVHGTQNVLASVAKSRDTVKRVVLTSSVAALFGIHDKEAPKNGSLYTEEDCAEGDPGMKLHPTCETRNKTSPTRPEKEAYHTSKVKAEEAAWEAAKRDGFDLVTILPNFVLGPVTSDRVDGTSIGHMKAWLEGEAGGNPACCDVRDVALAHILAAEDPTASGRYIVSQRTTSNPKEVGQWLQERFPAFEIPLGEEKAEEDVVDASKVQALGVAIKPFKETVLDMAQTLIQLGIAQPKAKTT